MYTVLESDWPTVSAQANPFGVVRLWDTGTAWENIEKVEGNPDWSLLDAYTNTRPGQRRPASCMNWR
jgi:hypothetical protein